MPAHIFLHLALCNAVAQAPPEAVIPIHVAMSYRVGGAEVDKVFPVTRGTGTQAVIEFDIRRSLYRLDVDVPKYRCGVSDFVDVLDDENNRAVTETLVDGAPPPAPPVVIMDGTAPLSFLYTKPAFVAFDKSVACDKPIAPVVPTQIRVEYDQGAYYTWLSTTPDLVARGPLTVALRLRTTTGLAHYVRLPIPFPVPWGGWPESVRFNVTEDMIDGLATEKADTLLCPKLWETSVR